MKQSKKIWKVLTHKERKEFGVLLLLTIIGAFWELLGVSAIMPFVNVAMDPESVHGEGTIAKIYEFLGGNSISHFLILIAIALVVVYFVKNLILILLYHYQYRFTYMSQQRMEGKLLSCYLSQKYEYHLSHNSAILQRNILQDVNGFYLSVISYLQFIAEILVCITLFGYLLFVDKTITIVITVFMGVFVLLFQGYFQKKIAKIGVESRAAGAKKVQWVQQSLNGIKEIKILGREPFFIGSFQKNALQYAEKQKKYQVTMAIPRPMMETMCICSLLLVVVFKLNRGVDISYFVPTLSVFVVAAFRLLPSFSRLSGYIGCISFQASAVERVYIDVQEAEELQRNEAKREDLKESIAFQKDLTLEGLTFCYPDTDKKILDNAKLCIYKNQSIAFIGPSGAGKTTLADVLLGVLEPQSGKILVDGKDIYRHMHAWHEMLGYIPQSIYLMDDTIRNNVAFGIREEEIDDVKIEKALQQAQLLDFVKGMEEGVNTFIGEGGVRLSGGQRQRIGIARALYNDPDILVLDEATSALDTETERAIMESIELLQGNKTLIIIAHRLTTIQNCDCIYEIADGKATLKKKEDVL